MELGEVENLVDEIIVLDGLTRAGKFLLGKLVSNFEQVEFFQYTPSLEHIPYMHKMGILSDQTAKSYMRTSANMAIYDLAIGRGLNRRPSDASTIINSTEKELYFERELRPDGHEAVNLLKSQKRRPSFLTHEILPLAEFYFDVFPQMKMINIQRHPIDLAYSWVTRNLGQRLGEDPIAFTPTFTQNGSKNFPWFAHEWSDEYRSLNETERVVKCIISIFDYEEEVWKNLDQSLKDNILFVIYEKFFSDPETEIQKISNFINCAPFSNMKKILEREGCFKPINPNSRDEKLNKLEKSISPSLKQELISISEKYNEKWK